jgi:hypothetical protein
VPFGGLSALSLRVRVLALTLAVVLLAAFVAVVVVLRGGDDRLAAELRSLTAADLDVLVLPLEAMGPEFADFEAVDAGFRDNRTAAENSLDPDDTEAELEELGRITGYDLVYVDPNGFGLVSGEGVLFVATSVELYKDAEGASEALGRQLGVFEEMEEQKFGSGVEEVSTFPVGSLGDDSLGVKVRYSSVPVDYYETLVAFTMDRLMIVATLGNVGDEAFIGQTQSLAQLMELRITGVLVGEISATPVSVAAFVPEEPPEGEEEPLGPGFTLGLRCSYASGFLREKYSLPPGKGCVVLRVSSPGAAERAGFQIGDKITELDGRPITSGRQFTFLFEEMPGARDHEFVVQRGDQELRLDVELADRAELPEDDPYFFYLRAKDDTETENYEQIITDYTRAIELEPEFDLAYLYRGITFLEGDQEDLARADLETALELDPQLTEAYRALARLAEQEGDLQAALEYIEESIRLNGCGQLLEEWDIDCAEDIAVRIDFLFHRLQEGDDLLIQEETERIENVVFFDLSVAYDYFKLAFLRGDDELARDLGEVFVSIPPNRLFPDLQGEQSRVQSMLDADSQVLNHSLWPWPVGRLVESEFYEQRSESPGGSDLNKTSDGTIVDFLLLFELAEPDEFRGENVAWELYRGRYRLASYQARNAFGDDWVVEFGLTAEPQPGPYELHVYVNGEPYDVVELVFP